MGRVLPYNPDPRRRFDMPKRKPVSESRLGIFLGWVLVALVALLAVLLPLAAVVGLITFIGRTVAGW